MSSNYNYSEDIQIKLTKIERYFLQRNIAVVTLVMLTLLTQEICRILDMVKRVK
jgi:hypothetical protein